MDRLSFGQLVPLKLSKTTLSCYYGSRWASFRRPVLRLGANSCPDPGQSTILLSRGGMEGHGGLRGEGLILLLGRPPWGQAGGVLPPRASSSPSRSTPPRPQPATWVLIPRSLCPPGTQSELGCPFPIWRRKKREWLGFPLALDTNLHLALLGGSMTAPHFQR